MPLTEASQQRWAAQALARIQELALTIPAASKLSGQKPRWLRPRLDCRQPIEEAEAGQVLDALGLVRYPPDLTAHHHPEHHPPSLVTHMPTIIPTTEPTVLETDSPFGEPPEGHHFDEDASRLLTSQLSPTITELAVKLLRVQGRAISQASVRVTRSSDRESLTLAVHCHVSKAPS